MFASLNVLNLVKMYAAFSGIKQKGGNVIVITTTTAIQSFDPCSSKGSVNYSFRCLMHRASHHEKPVAYGMYVPVVDITGGLLFPRQAQKATWYAMGARLNTYYFQLDRTRLRLPLISMKLSVEIKKNLPQPL